MKRAQTQSTSHWTKSLTTNLSTHHCFSKQQVPPRALANTHVSFWERTPCKLDNCVSIDWNPDWLGKGAGWHPACSPFKSYETQRGELHIERKCQIPRSILSVSVAVWLIIFCCLWSVHILISVFPAHSDRSLITSALMVSPQQMLAGDKNAERKNQTRNCAVGETNTLFLNQNASQISRISGWYWLLTKYQISASRPKKAPTVGRPHENPL